MINGCECRSMRLNSFHPAVSYLVGGMNARGGVAAPPRIPRLHEPQASGDSLACASSGFSINCEHAPGYFPAEHHGTAEHQDRAAIRARRGLGAESCLISAITGARTGARGGFSRHRQLPKAVRNTVSLKTRLPVPGQPLRHWAARPAQQQREQGQGDTVSRVFRLTVAGPVNRQSAGVCYEP